MHIRLRQLATEPAAEGPETGSRRDRWRKAWGTVDGRFIARRERSYSAPDAWTVTDTATGETCDAWTLQECRSRIAHATVTGEALAAWPESARFALQDAVHARRVARYRDGLTAAAQAADARRMREAARVAERAAAIIRKIARRG